ncbi:hypothetical protein EWH71_13080 [Enterococcus faecium]|nr:hypothetical protein EWI06_13315 [Enterococcus faecium]RYJ99985.1 hypothetical protein EWH81_13420 [Enterococcus faecium]RYK07415.1 hypothetical protein EWH71_13080 [Enterococcus faecium]RYK09431.1 hypothetical protein EWH90_13325 [Enterococcus faecium]
MISIIWFLFFFIFFSYLKVIKIDSFLVYHTSAMKNLTQNLLKKDNSSILVKSRLLCKMLYNVFTISTYQN